VTTTVHIPDELLRRLDAHARALGVSRNRVVLRALEKELEAPGEWAPEVVRLLTERPSRAVVGAATEMDAIIRAGRRSRRAPPEL
jgi:predicted transcriptional regulator